MTAILDQFQKLWLSLHCTGELLEYRGEPSQTVSILSYLLVRGYQGSKCQAINRIFFLEMTCPAIFRLILQGRDLHLPGQKLCAGLPWLVAGGGWKEVPPLSVPVLLLLSAPSESLLVQWEGMKIQWGMPGANHCSPYAQDSDPLSVPPFPFFRI